MGPDALARIFALPLSQFGRRFALAEVLGKPVCLRGPRLRPGPKTTSPTGDDSPKPKKTTSEPG